MKITILLIAMLYCNLFNSNNASLISLAETAPEKPALEDLPISKENLMLALNHYELSHHDILYAQAILETGHFQSRIFKEKNNLFGLYDSSNMEFFKFEHWSHSVRGYKRSIQYRIKEGEDYYSFLSRIKYAEDPDYIIKIKKIVNQ